MLALKAAIGATQGNQENALATLRQALQMVADENFTRAFVDIGNPRKEILKQETRERRSGKCRLSRNYLEYLLDALKPFEVPCAAVTPEDRHPPSPLIESLCAREMAVLQMISAGKSDKEAENERVLSVSTVKTHLKNAYGRF